MQQLEIASSYSQVKKYSFMDAPLAECLTAAIRAGVPLHEPFLQSCLQAS